MLISSLGIYLFEGKLHCFPLCGTWKLASYLFTERKYKTTEITTEYAAETHVINGKLLQWRTSAVFKLGKQLFLEGKVRF